MNVSGADSRHELARPIWADVDLEAITHNIGVLRKKAGRPVKIIVPVKANAYGQGFVEVSRHLERIGVDGLATANVDDALSARRAGVRLPILIYGAQLPDGNGFLIEHDLTPSIYSREGLNALAALADGLGRKISLHVKVDAGLGRLGVRLDEAAAFVREVLARPRLELEGIYTHIPFGDASGEAWSRRRMSAFSDLVSSIETEHGISIPFTQGAASSVFTREFPDPLNTISPGHLIYGLCPIEGVKAESLGLRKALTALRSRLIHVGQRRKGDDVYGTGPDGVSEDVTVGVTLIGMDNGYNPAAPGQTAFMLCNGEPCEVLSVFAEYSVIDLSRVPGAKLGDVVTIIGDDGENRITVEDVAVQVGAPNAAYWMVGLKNVVMRYHH